MRPAPKNESPLGGGLGKGKPKNDAIRTLPSSRRAFKSNRADKSADFIFQLDRLLAPLPRDCIAVHVKSWNQWIRLPRPIRLQKFEQFFLLGEWPAANGRVLVRFDIYEEELWLVSNWGTTVRLRFAKGGKSRCSSRRAPIHYSSGPWLKPMRRGDVASADLFLMRGAS